MWGSALYVFPRWGEHFTSTGLHQRRMQGWNCHADKPKFPFFYISEVHKEPLPRNAVFSTVDGLTTPHLLYEYPTYKNVVALIRRVAIPAALARGSLGGPPVTHLALARHVDKNSAFADNTPRHPTRSLVTALATQWLRTRKRIRNTLNTTFLMGM